MSSLLSRAFTACGVLGWTATSLSIGCSSLESGVALSDSAGVQVERETAPDDLVGVGNDQGPEPPPEEVEREASFRAPVVTGRYVWTANPESGQVAAIDAETLEIRAGEAGFRPTHVAAVSQGDEPPRALVINTGSNDATLLSASAEGIATETVPLHQGADSLSVAPGARFVVAWTDSSKAESLDPTDGFQDITVLELRDGAPAESTRLTVGYRPSAIAFDAAGEHAFAITQDGISVLELQSGNVQLSRLVSLPNRLGSQPDVSVTPDGSRALARIAGSASLYDIDLVSGQSRELTLPGVISDFDLSADGQNAVAVIRGGLIAPPPASPDAGSPVDAGDAAAPEAGAAVTSPATAVFIPIPAGLDDESLRRTVTSPNETFGSVALSPDGTRAVLFTTATPSGRVTLVSPTHAPRSVDLLAPVRAVFLTADGGHALALQDPAPGSTRKGAFSVLSIDDVRAPKLVASDAPAEAVSIPPAASERALVTVSDPATNTFGTFLVRLPNLQVDFASLPTRPLSSGTVPLANKAFVAQAHPEGRITFIALEDGSSRELTGFELSSKVINQ